MVSTAAAVVDQGYAPTPERRFTAPGFDAKETQIMATAPDAATEAFAQPHTQQQPQPGNAAPTSPPPGTPPKAALPQAIPPRSGKLPVIPAKFNWGWVLAITVIILAIAVIAVMLAVLLTKNKHQAASQDDKVRETIQNYVTALQKGDLTTLRSMTCGATRDSYVEMDGHGWDETYRGVSAAKQYPVLGSIDQVVVNGQHAEANITTFMAYDPQVRSTRSLDLQFRDDQWKICQTSS